MQFVFQSYSYDTQRHIVNLLLTSKCEKSSPSRIFEPTVTLKHPYSLFVLMELLEQPDSFDGALQVAKELSKTLPDETLLLVGHIDRHLTE